ncbi:carbamoyltransferase family protein [Halogranum rubrum]|uniref:Carbamoyltransferase n=1 Tax=Halogranum salarium B-1 TaxID=1210908 RepID=J3JCV6_9EURY|nr:carbamoyltransferase C-terminal domain-containing protein [Halogranum salarium]EJN56944.1 carbamoyltransferase [Halogranum salarium B-1]
MTEFTLTFKPAIGLYGKHDPSAALFEDGELVYGVEEERFTRQKHAVDTFPQHAIKACLDYRGLVLSDVDQIILPYDPSLRSNIAEHYLRNAIQEPDIGAKLHRLQQTVVREAQAKFYPVRQIKTRLEAIGTPVPSIETCAHHACHAASAFYPSGFDDALVLTIDAKGEYDSTVIWKGTQDGLKRVKTYEHPNSLGLFFATITEFLGYRMFNGEGKVMGLAPYGSDNPEIERKLRSLIDTSAKYDVTALSQEFGTNKGVTALEELFGRQARTETGEFTQWEKDLAYTAQKLLEEIVVNIVEACCPQFNTNNVALAGGVVLNCKMNKRIIESDFVDEAFIQPVAHDAGLALGAGWLDQSPKDVPKMTDLYWGPEYNTDEIRSLLETNKIEYQEPDNLEQYVAEQLADGKLVGWFQGRLELGPRALGNRSILADPRTAESRDRVNRYVKHREEWRPFAPSMLEEVADEFLESGRPAPFMITTSNVRPEQTGNLTAVLHPSDDTTRPQTVREEQNSRYYQLIKEFGEITGVPVVLNTSFNDHGEPIVTTPKEALKDFYGMGLDTLVLEDIVIEK